MTTVDARPRQMGRRTDRRTNITARARRFILTNALRAKNYTSSKNCKSDQAEIEAETTSYTSWVGYHHSKLNPTWRTAASLKIAICHNFAADDTINMKFDTPIENPTLMTKLTWHYNSVCDHSIWTKFGTLMQNHMPTTEKSSIWKAEVEFQYGDHLPLGTGSSNISVVDWGIWSEFGMQIVSYLQKHEM